MSADVRDVPPEPASWLRPKAVVHDTVIDKDAVVQEITDRYLSDAADHEGYAILRPVGGGTEWTRRLSLLERVEAQ